MSRVTSRQRRANDRRRFWSGYPALVALWVEWGLPHQESAMRGQYRSDKTLDREAKRRARRGIPNRQCYTVPCPPFKEVQF